MPPKRKGHVPLLASKIRSKLGNVRNIRLYNVLSRLCDNEQGERQLDVKKRRRQGCNAAKQQKRKRTRPGRAKAARPTRSNSKPTKKGKRQ